jgi:hypothetical protein
VWASGDPPGHSERAKKVWSGTLDIPPGREAAMTMTYSVPEAVQTKGGRSTYKLVLQHQPGVHPPHMTVTIHLPRGARKVSAPGFERRADTLVWDRPMNKDLVLRVSWSAAT